MPLVGGGAGGREAQWSGWPLDACQAWLASKILGDEDLAQEFDIIWNAMIKLRERYNFLSVRLEARCVQALAKERTK